MIAPGEWKRRAEALKAERDAALALALKEALDELTSALADARRRYAAGDGRAIESSALAATERQARALLAAVERLGR